MIKSHIIKYVIGGAVGLMLATTSIFVYMILTSPLLQITKVEEQPAKAMNEQEPIEDGKAVKTRLPVVYQMPDGNFKVLPFLDLNLKKHVIGIWYNGTCFGLKNLGMHDWYSAMEMAEKSGPGWELPAGKDVQGFRFRMDRPGFELTIDTLKNEGIDADRWQTGGGPDTYYWTKTSYSKDTESAGWFRFVARGALGNHSKSALNNARLVNKQVKK